MRLKVGITPELLKKEDCKDVKSFLRQHLLICPKQFDIVDGWNEEMNCVEAEVAMEDQAWLDQIR